jgi:hypothetical protein
VRFIVSNSCNLLGGIRRNSDFTIGRLPFGPPFLFGGKRATVLKNKKAQIRPIILQCHASWSGLSTPNSRASDALSVNGFSGLRVRLLEKHSTK